MEQGGASKDEEATELGGTSRVQQQWRKQGAWWDRIIHQTKFTGEKRVDVLGQVPTGVRLNNRLGHGTRAAAGSFSKMIPPIGKVSLALVLTLISGVYPLVLGL